MKTDEARRYVIEGRVQGVGFRMFTADRARAYGVTGHVRNLPDGRVEVVARGQTATLERFERDVRRGPPGALVTGVEVERVERLEDPASFVIRA